MTRTTFALLVDIFTTAALPPPRLCDSYALSLPQPLATLRYRTPPIVATPLSDNDLAPIARQPRSTPPHWETPQHQKHLVASHAFFSFPDDTAIKSLILPPNIHHPTPPLSSADHIYLLLCLLPYYTESSSFRTLYTQLFSYTSCPSHLEPPGPD